MSNIITISRPYAKAIFDLAVEYQNIEHWQTMLEFAAKISSHRKIIQFLSSSLAPEIVSDIFNTICSDQLNKHAQNLIKIMAENRRLLLLPTVLKQFIQLRNMYESIIKIDVISAIVLQDSQLLKIKIAMEKYLLCRIKLNYRIDNSIIGGLIIRANSLVIDGSIRGRIESLAKALRFQGD
ncbi:F0F1 ATP synthase subunit delta [Pantoea sp. Mhis]|uniref:F0F1 ATP synthase subunit delta n=1 Tax=Pantoea sp. Mhis TaxID=2576759 RepID=UPI0013590BDF|nr:F0F1 ATP synthase subunit delta [Pantoea sp. Mhis]MXP56752.1 F0F1 ATP synthase subunit delta [Pantoea sp. Mhis]